MNDNDKIDMDGNSSKEKETRILMKKLLTVLLAVLVCFTLAACGNSNDGGDDTAAVGKVYYLNFKPEADEAWQELAKKYTEETGVEVKVVTAASGNYDTSLQNELGKADSELTMFQLTNDGAVSTYGDYCIDLAGSGVYNEMTTHDFDLTSDGKTLGIGYCYECFGIIVNKALLKQAGYEISDITNFETLKAVAEDIHARADELGFDAFTSAGLADSSSWRFSGHLITLPLHYEGITSKTEIKGTYLDEYKNIWDLYLNNSATDPVANNEAGDEAEATFGEGKAVFYQNGSWEYSALTTTYGISADDLQMIPIYCGHGGEENAALCSGTEAHWAVSNLASEEDQQATLDFMKWVVTSDAGTTMMAEQFGPIPFKSAKEPENVFFAQANALLAEGKYNVSWAFNYTPAVDDFRAGLVSALKQYAVDGNWDTVKTAFVDGWNTLLAQEAE